MTRTRTNRKQTRLLDALIALPLARFRTAIRRLARDELAALEQHISLMTVKQRWALGAHGLERHRAPNELGLLARRLAETRHEAEKRATATSAQLRLIEIEPVAQAEHALDLVDQAA